MRLTPLRRPALAAALSLAAGIGYAQSTPPAPGDPKAAGTVLSFGLKSTLRSDSNLELLPASPGRATLFDTALSFGIRSVTRTDTFQADLSGVLRAAHLPVTGNDTRLDDREAKISYSHQGAGSSFDVSGYASTASLRYLNPLTETTLAGSDLTQGASGKRRLYGGKLDFETGVGGPFGTFVSAQADARRYSSGASPGLYDSTSSQLSVGARAQLADTTTGKLALTQSYYSADDTGATRLNQTALGFTLGQDFGATTHLDATIGAARQRLTSGGGTLQQSLPTATLDLTTQTEAGQTEARLDRSLSPSGARDTAEVGQAFDLPGASLSYSLGASHLERGATQAIGNLSYIEALKRGEIRFSLSRQVASPWDFTGLDATEELITRADATYRYSINQLNMLRLSLDYARVDPVGGNGVVQHDWGAVTAAYERNLTPDWVLTAGYTFRRASAPTTGAATGNSVFVSIGRSFEVRP